MHLHMGVRKPEASMTPPAATPPATTPPATVVPQANTPDWLKRGNHPGLAQEMAQMTQGATPDTTPGSAASHKKKQRMNPCLHWTSADDELVASQVE